MKRTGPQNKTLHALIGALNIDTELKSDLVLGATNGRTCSTSEMDVNECNQLITHLRSIARKNNGDRMRKKVLSICYQLGWTLGNKVDFERLNFFLKTRGHPKRCNLNDYNVSELPGLITQFELMAAKTTK